MKKKVKFLFLFLQTLLAFPLLAQPEKEVDKYESLNAEISRILKQTKVVGVSVAIIDNYKVTWAKGFGLKQIGSKDSITTETLFQAASITKAVTAMAVMRKVQEGKLSLEGDVNNQLISWKIPENNYTKQTAVTLQQLLSHTGGIANTPFPRYEPSDKIPTVQEALNGMPPATNTAVNVAYYPGKQFSYSAGGYAIIQQLLMDVEQKEYTQLMEEVIFEPLGMHHSTFEYQLPNQKFRSVASGHLQGNQVIESKYFVVHPLTFGGLWSTPTDLATFLIEIQLSLQGKSNRILAKEFTQTMLKPVQQTTPPNQYGLGFGLEKRGTGVLFFGHDGHNYGYISSMLASFDNGFGVVIMTNGENGWKAVNKIKKLVGRKYWGF